MTYQTAKPVASRVQASQCPACGGNVVMLAVGGHLQCPECTTVVESCCEGPIPSFTQNTTNNQRELTLQIGRRK